MCIGLPCKIVQILDHAPNTALVQANGVEREVDISLIHTEDPSRQSLIGKWVLVHVGFAMNLLDEKDAQQTLSALKAMEELEPDVGIFLNRDK